MTKDPSTAKLEKQMLANAKSNQKKADKESVEMVHHQPTVSSSKVKAKK